MERNEKRNKALGISSNQSSLLEESSFIDKENKRQDTVKVSSPRKSAQTSQVTRYSNTPKTVSSKKEDADVAVEINITSSQNIQVEKVY